MPHDLGKLAQHILPLSRSQVFSEAVREWGLESVELSDEFGHCPCGHKIKEHCHIANRLTREVTWVGNVCIDRFMGINTGNVFAGLKRIVRDITANANLDLIEYARERGWLRGNDYGFLIGTSRQRVLSARQIAWKEDINRRIIAMMVTRASPRCEVPRPRNCKTRLKRKSRASRARLRLKRGVRVF